MALSISLGLGCAIIMLLTLLPWTRGAFKLRLADHKSAITMATRAVMQRTVVLPFFRGADPQGTRMVAPRAIMQDKSTPGRGFVPQKDLTGMPWIDRRTQKGKTTRERRRPPLEDGYLSDYLTSRDEVQMPRVIYQGRSPDLMLSAVRFGYWGLDVNGYRSNNGPPDDLGIGATLASIFESGAASRENMFIQMHLNLGDAAELNPGRPIAEQVELSLANMLSKVGLTYVDSLVLDLLHTDLNQTMEAWRAMELAHQADLVRQLGVSNVSSMDLLTSVYENATIKPAVLHHRFFKPSELERELLDWCRAETVILQQAWTLPDNRYPMKSARMDELAKKKYGVSPQALFFRWNMAKGIIPLSVSPQAQLMKEHVQSQRIPLTRADSEFLDDLIENTGRRYR